MIAMQYSFALPADYDMQIIERRIREKGALMDGFGGLGFKAYLSARRAGGAAPSVTNLYAPFYLWQRTEGMADFLTGPAFAALSRDFGRPRVETWAVWHARLPTGPGAARFAARETLPLDADANLAAISAAEVEEVERALSQGALAAVTGFDPGQWEMVRFRLWPELPNHRARGVQFYEVGHISKG